MAADTEFLDRLKVRHFAPHLDQSGFRCDEAVDWFLRNKAQEFHEKRINTMLCWLDGERLAGFMTTSMCLLKIESSKERERLGLQGIVVREGSKQYVEFGATLIGVLGVCVDYRRRGLGERMVRTAIGQSLATSEIVGCRFVIVDSTKSDEAIGLYKRCTFDVLEGQEEKRATLRMYYDLRTR